MANEIRAKNKIAYYLLKNGDTLSPIIESNPPLYQAISNDGMKVLPSFLVAENQPVSRMRVLSSLQGVYVDLIEGTEKFYWNDQLLGFAANGVSNSPAGWSGFFKKENGTLRVIKDIASSNNRSNNTLKISGKVSTGGIEKDVTATVPFTFGELGGTPYKLLVNLSSTTIDTPDAVISARARLLSDIEMQSGFTVDWMRTVSVGNDADGWENYKSGISINIPASDVRGREMFMAVAKIGGNEVGRYVFDIFDTQDSYYISTPQKEYAMDEGESITFDVKLIDKYTGATIPGIKFESTHYDTLGRVFVPSVAATNNGSRITLSSADLKRLNAEGNETGAASVDITATSL